MLKLRKYLKPFALSIVLIIGLLFIQAQCELALPDYMSTIVSNGIQGGGITNGVPNAIRESTIDKANSFLDDEAKTLFQNNYKLIVKENATASELKSYPILKEENIYLLNTKDKDIIANIESKLSSSFLIIQGIDGGMLDDKMATMDVPTGMSIYEVLAFMPQEQIQAMKDAVQEQVALMGETTAQTAAKQFVKTEYELIGMNTNNIQNQYIVGKGAQMLGITFIGSLCAISVGFLSARLAAGLSRKLRSDVFTKVESFSNAEYNKFSTASLITRTTNDIQQIQMVIVMVLRIVIYAPILGIGALLKVMQSDVSMTWIIGLVIVVILGIIATVFAMAMPKFKIVQQLVDKLNLVMREFLEGMPVIRAFNNEKEEERKFDKANKDITKTNLFVNRILVTMMPLMNLVMNGAILLIVWYSAKQIDLGTLQIGDMMAFMQYAMQIIMSFLMISMISIMLPRASIAVNRVFEVLETKNEIQDPTTIEEFNANLKGTVEFKNVSFRYPGAEADILSNINFTAKPGQTTAFIGSTGSGKSTIINLIPRFFDVTQGEVLVDGVNIKNVKQHDLREKIGFVPQKGVLFSGTIASNLQFGKENASLDDMIESSEVAQAMEFISNKPEQFDTSIAQGGTNVSGGQKQRLSIARALIKKPEIYIFDDSFSALDFKTDASLRKALNEYTKDSLSTIFIVGQRVSSIMHSDQIIVLDKGKIAGIGTHKELIENCDVYQEIVYSQLSKEELDHE